MKKKRKRVLTQKNRVKNLKTDKNKRQKLREKRKLLIRANNSLLVQFIFQQILFILSFFDFALQIFHSRNQRIYLYLQSCFHDFNLVDHVDQIFFQLQHVEFRKIRLRR